MTNISKKSFHILNPRLDPNFKAIFTQNTQASKIALKSFLSAAIGRDVKEYLDEFCKFFCIIKSHIVCKKDLAIPITPLIIKK